jgi:sarcosine oxidase subunit gamma
MSDFPLRLERVSDLGYLNLRGNATDSGFVQAVESSVGIKLPVTANTVAGTERQAYWLSPDEWLLVSTGDDIEKCRAELDESLREHRSAVNDLSGGFVAYKLRGRGSRQLLAKGCTLDLHPGAFKTGCCAQTGLAKANVILSLSGDGDGFDVIVRRSFADYVWQWLLHAGRNLGIEVA